MRSIVVNVLVFIALGSLPAAAQNVSLTINLTGPNNGTVGVIPSGLLCSKPGSTSCTVSFAPGTSVRIVANGGAGTSSPPGIFSGGTGSATACGTSTCTFTIQTDSTVTATFDNSLGPFYSVSITFAGDGQGIVGADNSHRQNQDPPTAGQSGTAYAANSVVALGATAAPESRFSGFSNGTNGAVSCGTAANCSFTITANASVTVTFHAMSSLAVEPATASIAVGKTQAYTAKGTFTNGVTETVSSIGSGVWRTRTQLATGRHSLAAAVSGSRIYALGGVVGAIAGGSPGSTSATVESYDPITNVWAPHASMATARSGHGAATVGDLIYVIGGNSTAAAPIASVERFDPAANTWSSRASLAVGRRFLTTAAVNGVVYAIGGETSSGVVATVEAYDPATDTWSPKAPLKSARKLLSATVAGNLIYVAGGADAGGNAVTSVEVYDPLLDTWTAKAPLAGARSMLAGASADGVLYAIGGQDSNASATTTAYDPVANQWGNKASLITSRAELAAVTLGGIVYAIGGRSGSGNTLRNVEAFTDNVRWSSANTAVGTITQSQALGQGVSPGQTTITATIGAMTCAAASACGTLNVTPNLSTMAIDRTSLAFGATVDAGTVISATAPATIRLGQTGTNAVTWTATASQPWLKIEPASGTGSALIGVSIVSSPALPASGTVTASIAFQLTGASNTVGPVSVSLTVTPKTAPASVPFGSFDTPPGDGTVLAGSVAVTGWALDNIGIKRVEIWRDLQAGEPTTPFSSTPTDPRHGKVFVSNATFVEGARPDVETLNPTTPANYRAGWGYLLLTQGLFGQGNGTYKLYAFAFDQEDNVSTLGSKTLVVNNNAAVKPFGSIDTPALGGDPGTTPNFGWALTPKVNGAATCRIGPNGVQVSIDSGPLQPVVYGDARADIADAFPGFSNSAAAGGHFIFDWSTLTNGVHTIGWLVTDDCGRADGIGSRFFTVTTGASALTAPPSGLQAESSSAAGFRLKAETTEERDSDQLLLSRGYGELAEIVVPDLAGSRTIDVKQSERIELQMPRGYETGYQLGPNGERRPLPIGSTWDPASGTFSWQPAPGFLGRYRLVFGNGDARIDVRVIVVPDDRLR